MTDAELLASYASSGSEQAFAEIVSRYAPMVYSACRRALGAGPDAQDAAQAAFLVLVRKAASLPAATDLPAWLYQAARYAANDLRKQTARRKRHEREAMTMRTRAAEGESASWESVRPQLDAALAELPADQRQALVLRYLCGLDPDEVARRLGIGPDAAAKRTTRALDWLRRRLVRRGVTVPAAGLGAMLAGHAVEAVPAGLVGSIQAVCSGKAAATGAVADLAKGAMKMMFWAKVKAVAAVVAAVTVVGAGGGTLAGKFTRWGGLAAGEPAAQTVAAAGTPADLALSAALIEKTGIKGGLCLVLGAKDPALAKGLAAQSALYVQALQPDAKLAAAWGAEFAAQDCQDREKLGVRNAAFEADHYGSDLFNLIVVEDAAALGKAKLADMNRILVPKGCVAFRSAPESLSAEAKSLEMIAQQAGAYAAVYRKPVKPVEWKVCDSLKWRAGPRASINVGFSGLTSGDGRFFYREQMEVDGEFTVGRRQIFARDAYNGRTLWTREEPVGWGPRVGWGPTRSLWADNKGRLFACTSDGKFVCLDAATGKLRFEILPNVTAEADVSVVNDDYLFAYGQVFSAENGKPLWRLPAGSLAVEKDTAYFLAGKTLGARNIADGRQLWSTEVAGLPPAKGGYGLFSSGKYLHATTGGGRWERPFTISTLDMASGKLLWSRTLEGVLGSQPAGSDSYPHYMTLGDKLLAVGWGIGRPDKELNMMLITRMDLATGKVEEQDYGPKGPTMWSGGCYGQTILGDYMVGHHNLWVNLKTLERTFPLLVHPACFIGKIPSRGMGLIYNVPSRKWDQVSGITAIGPTDIAFDHEPGGKVLQRFAAAAAGEATTDADWPMFRGGPARGNSCKAALGDKPVKAWETQIALGGKSFGVMSGQRTGLTQPVSAYGLAIVSDIDGGRIVAVNAADGKPKWTFHVGSRVDWSPTLYRGLCLFAAKDGWVYCLDARTGTLAWKLLVPARERYIGGQEKIESMWPTADVWVADGIGYVTAGFAGGFYGPGGRGTTGHGGFREVAFRPETGEVVGSQCTSQGNSPTGHPGHRPAPVVNGKIPPRPKVERMAIDDDGLAFLNSLSRTNEDRGGALFGNGKVAGRVVAFDDALSVAYTFKPAGEAWANKGVLNLTAVKDNPKAPLWSSPPIELIVDDLLLTPQRIYAVGHYQRIKKDPEIWVMSREDGKVLNTVPVEGFPAFFGMSAADNRLFLATREGKLICYQGK